jgi:hydrogenase maturation factor
MSNIPYALGKLPSHHLAQILDRLTVTDPRVVLGPGVGRDAAVVSFGDRYLVAKTDPITFATDEIGWYAVHINTNDIACTGASPRWFLATLLLPGGTSDRAMVEEIFDQIMLACAEVGATLVGGHTEITHGLDRPIVVGCMLGEVEPEMLVRPEDTEVGDAVILTKGIAIEGTAIIAREAANSLGQIDRATLDRAKEFLRDPGISVMRDAAVATAAGTVRALHDPTEGGLVTGLWEMAEAVSHGLVVYEDSIPVYPACRALCQAAGLDPLGLIASGALLMIVAPQDVSDVAGALAAEGIAATAIGHVAEGPRGVTLRTRSGDRPAPRFARDEIVRLFE